MLFILTSKRKLPHHTEKTIRILAGKIKKRGIDSKTISLESLEVFLNGKGAVMKMKNWSPNKHSAVYFRIVEKYKNASYIFSKYLETKKIPFIDHYHTSTRERNKLIQMFLLSINGVSIPKTYYTPVYDANKAKSAVKFLRFPIVVKLTNKERGEGVFLARNIKGLTRILEKNKEQEIILQEFLDNDFDYRILVLGHKTRLGEKRIRMDKKEFRNNTCIGAREEFMAASTILEKIKRISERSSKIMDIQVCGVDVIESREGKAYVIETNFAPSFTLGDKMSDELNQLADFLKKWHEKK
jgi:RimK family alpha-L-glutamate ligase